LHTKQFILFSIGILIIGAIIWFFLARTTPAESNRQAFKVILTTLVKDAQNYYRKSSQKNFSGWGAPEYLKIEEAGRIAEKINDNEIIITCLGNEIGFNGKSKVKLQLKILPDDSRLRIIN
jgi:hypothetical protein